MKLDYANTKAFSVRLPKELWTFYKILSVANDEPMGEIINRALDKYRKSMEGKKVEAVK